MSGPYVLGIDYGTQSCRVGIFDLTGHAIGLAATEYATSHPRPGWAEQNPIDWWLAVQNSTRQALAQSKVNPADIIAIAQDATTTTVVAADADGEPLRPAIMWMDVRATEQADRANSIQAGTPAHNARLYNGGGTAPASPEFYPFKVAWLKDNEPEIFNKAAYLVDATDWVTHRLTGQWTVNINSAAQRMYHNRDYGGWPVEFYQHIGVGEIFSKVPERVLDLGSPVGGLTQEAADALGLKAGTPVAQGPCDAWAGQIGLGVVRPGKMVLITGSSHVISGQSAVPVYGPGFFGSFTDSVVPGQYTVEGGQVSTGSVMKWFRDNFARDVYSVAERTGLSVYDLLGQEASKIPVGSDGLIVNEYFQGNRTPYTDGKARGIVWGLSLAHGAAHVYHAIQEGICYGTAHILRSMKAAGFEASEIVICGGMTNSVPLMQMHADITGLPIVLNEVTDAVVLGSSMCAAVGAGAYPDLLGAADAMVRQVDTLQPNAARNQEYQFYIDQYISAYPALRPQIHQVVDHEAAKTQA